MLRQHDSVLAEGTFRIVLTEKHRVLAVLDAPHTMLGPLHLMVAIERGARHARPIASHKAHLLPAHSTGFSFSDIGDAIGHAAESTFNAASKAATTIARPAFDIAKHAASAGAHVIAHATPFLPQATRRQIDAAARIVIKARLGDVTAKQFIRNVVNAANEGLHAARAVADSLASGARLVARTIDVPVELLEHVPGIGGVVKSISPLQKFDKMIGNLQRGDFKSLERMVHDDLSMAQGIVSLIPGIGTGISAGISAGLAALEGGSPLEVALRTAYGAIPIPIGIRQVTDAVLGGVLALVFHPGHLTDVAITAARDAVPNGFPRDIFDTLVQLVVKKVPLRKAALGLVDHYVSQYAPGALHYGDVLTHSAPFEALAHADHFEHVADAARHAAHLEEISRQVHRYVHPAEHVAHNHEELARLLRPMHLMPA